VSARLVRRDAADPLAGSRRRRPGFDRDFGFAAFVAQIHFAVGRAATALAHDCRIGWRSSIDVPAACRDRSWAAAEQVRLFGFDAVTRARLWRHAGRAAER
jgi:hypothetical protein